MKFLTRPWLVCLSASLFFFYLFIQMNMPNSISKELMQSFDINTTKLGVFSSSFFYANSLFLLPAGILLDRVSTRKLILFSMMLCIVGTVLLSISPSFLFANAGRFLTGASDAFALLSCLRLISRWIPSTHSAYATGLAVAIGMLGGVVAQTPFTLLAHWIGWRQTLVVDAALGIVIMLIIYETVFDYPNNKMFQHEQEIKQLQTLKFWKSVQLVLMNFRNWLVGMYAGLTNLFLTILGSLWGNYYLTQVRDITLKQASIASSMIFIGMIIGSPTVGWLSDKIGKRKLPMILGSFFLIIVAFILIYTPHLTFEAIVFLFFIFGICSSMQVLGFCYVTEVNPPIITSTAMGFISILIMLCTAIAQPLFGWLISSFADHLNAETTIERFMSFQHALSILLISAVVSLICTAFLFETYCKPLIRTPSEG